MNPEALSDSELSRLKFELAEALSPVGIKGPVVKRLIARLERSETDQRAAQGQAALLRIALETVQKRINFVFGTTQNRSWETFLFELREGIALALKEAQAESKPEL